MQKKQVGVKDIVNSIPFSNRVIFVTVLALYLLELFGITAGLIVNDAGKVWSPTYQFWRVLFSSFSISTLFMLLLSTFNLYAFYPKLESKTSSLETLLNFIVVGFVIQLIYAFLVSFLPISLAIHVGFGNFCGIWFYLIFKYCYFSEGSRIKLCCFPMKIPKLIYPFVFLLAIMIICLQIKVDAFIGILLGLIQCKLFNGRLIKIKSDGVASFMSRFDSWVPAQQTDQNGQVFYELQEDDSRQTQSTSASKNDYFKNKKGVRLG